MYYGNNQCIDAILTYNQNNIVTANYKMILYLPLMSSALAIHGYYGLTDAKVVKSYVVFFINTFIEFQYA